MTLGYQMATFSYTGAEVQKAAAVGSDLGQQQNWLLSVPSCPSVLGLGLQICHHAEVDSKKKNYPDERYDRDVGHQMAHFVALALLCRSGWQ